MNKSRFAFAFLWAFLTLPLIAQTAHNTNIGVKTRKIVCPILSDVKFNSTYVDLKIVDVTEGNFPVSSVIQSAWDIANYSSNKILPETLAKRYPNLGLSQISYLGTLWEWATFAQVVYESVLAVSQSIHQQYRIYKVSIPAWGQYKFSFNLVGDYDNPKNTISIYRKELQIWETEKSLMDNRSMSWEGIWIGQGEIFVAVGLDNQSVLLHSAGVLTRVESTTPMEWVETIDIAENSPTVISATPSIGSTANISVQIPSGISEGSISPIFFGIGTMQYNNIRKLPEAILTVLGLPDYKIQQIYDTGGHVWEPNITTLGSTFVNGRATYTVKRLADEEIGNY